MKRDFEIVAEVKLVIDRKQWTAIPLFRGRSAPGQLFFNAFMADCLSL
jgi:hypothetical protein